MVIKSLIWSNGELIRALEGGLEYREVQSSVQMAVSIQKRILFFFTKKFQKVSCSKQLLIIP